MARFGVRLGSLAFAHLREDPANMTDSANGRERVRTSPALAMQKAVGSSPIIRLYTLQNGIF
jgi:hypothetical protein